MFDFDQTDDGAVLAGHTTGYDPSTGIASCSERMQRATSCGHRLWQPKRLQPRVHSRRVLWDPTNPRRWICHGGGSGDEQLLEDTHPAGSSDEWKAYVIKTDSNGDLEWEAVYDDGPDNGNNAAEYIGLTDDGGYILFTDTDSTGEMTQKLDSWCLTPEP